MNLKTNKVVFLYILICLSCLSGMSYAQEDNSVDPVLEPVMTIEELTAAAEKGDVEASFRLLDYYWSAKEIELDHAISYGYLIGMSKNNIEMATNFQNKIGLIEGALQGPHIFDKSITNNESSGYYWKGVCYRYGYGTDTDMNKALSFFGESAARGSIMALYELGLINYHGLGQAKDQAEAYKYLTAFIHFYPYVFGSNYPEAGLLNSYLKNLSKDLSSSASKQNKKLSDTYIQSFSQLI